MGKAAKWFKGLFGMKKSKEGENKISGVDSIDGGTHIPRNILPADPAWLRTYLAETEKEQSKHAIAVAAATAAAADAAVAAAQAAVAVVMLTSNGRVGGLIAETGRERWAAVKIQSVFRGYLARKALRALRGLVKLQAFVRGYLVRKRAAATLQSMQALLRAQTAIRSQRINRWMNKTDVNMFQPRQSVERFEDSRSEIHSKRIINSVDQHSNNTYDENSPKIVEMDTSKTKSRSRRMNLALSECGDDLLYQGKDFEWSFPLEKCKFSTAQSTPRFSYPAHNNFYAPHSPVKSVCGDAYFGPGYVNSLTPSYMANTQSFKAKLRSHSAPRQRPERKRLSLDEVMAARSSVSSVRMVQQQRTSCSYNHLFQDAIHFKFFK